MRAMVLAPLACVNGKVVEAVCYQASRRLCLKHFYESNQNTKRIYQNVIALLGVEQDFFSPSSLPCLTGQHNKTNYSSI